MSRYSESFGLRVEPEEAEEVCREAVAGLGWRVLESRPGRIVIKEVTPRVTSFTWAAKIRVDITAHDEGTALEVVGSVAGVGPIQSGHLKGQLGAFRNHVEVIAGQRAKSGSEAPVVSEELSNLAQLHRDGVLTDEEFAQAKKQALGPA